MSALDKALRQIERQRQIREDAASTQGLVSEFPFPVESARPRSSRWMPVALVVLSLALAATWLTIADWWPASLPTLSGWPFMDKPDARSDNPTGSAPSGPPPALPLSVTPTTELAPVSAALPALGSSEPAPVAAAVVPAHLQPSHTGVPTAANVPENLAAPQAATERGKPGVADPANKFTYPAWHKGADRMWNWGLWDEASRVWLKGLMSEDPNAPMLLIADQLTQLQVTRQYAAWSPLLPVVALSKSGGSKKQWVLLAVLTPNDLARAQQLLRIARGQEGTVARWAQWQKTLNLNEGTDAAAGQPLQIDAPATPAALAAPASPTARTAVPSAPAMPSPTGAGRARDLAVLKAQGDSQGEGRSESPLDVKPRGLAQAEQEAPQLSRTEGERLTASGPVPPTAKAIDVDYQMIEKSLAIGDHQAALDAANKLEKYIGENWRTQYLAGVALMGLNRWEPAIAALGKAQELNPKHATAALYLSVALQERGEHARAIQVLDKAQQLQPLSPELWLNQGHSHQALGHKVEARKAYNRFLELSVNRQDLAVQRVWVQNRLQKDNG